MLRTAPLLALILAAPASADERRYMISGFDRIRVEGPYEVEVTSGASAGATATGEARALDAVSVRVQGGTLVIGRGLNAWGGFPDERVATPRIAVRTGDLRQASVTGGGRLTVDRMRGLRVELNLSGSGVLDVGAIDADAVQATLIGAGAIRAAGRALRARFQSDGAGTIDAAALDVRDLTVVAQSAGDASFAATDTANVTASGTGAVRVAGSASCTVRGPAPVECGTGAER